MVRRMPGTREVKEPPVGGPKTSEMLPHRGKTLRSPIPREKKTISGETLRSGRQMAVKTHLWMERNENAFFAIYNYVKEKQRKGCKGRLRDRVASYCVDNQIVVGGDYAFDNTLWAGISRYLVLHDRSLLNDPVKARESNIDCFGLYPVSYLDLEDE